MAAKRRSCRRPKPSAREEGLDAIARPSPDAARGIGRAGCFPPQPTATRACYGRKPARVRLGGYGAGGVSDSFEKGDFVVGARTRGNRHQRLVYLQEHLRELRQLAEGDGLPLIGYFVEMAYIEACDTVRKERPFDASVGNNNVPHPALARD